jgi:hypothetical protein
MTSRTLVLFIVAALGLATPSVVAHQVTYKGTVIAVTVTAPDEASVRVRVVNPETQRALALTFMVDDETKILRGDTLVTLAQARIRPEENIAVTINDDLDDMFALVIRLDSRE